MLAPDTTAANSLFFSPFFARPLKASLLLLLLPLHSFAQFGRSYTGPTMQQNQQSRQYFNQMTNQRTQDFQSRQLQRSRPGGSPLTQQTRLQAQANQQKLEQEATEKLARLAQEQQRRREEHPAKNAKLAAAQQKADEKQLTLLAVKNYREVFLPGQVMSALEAQQLSPRAQQSLRALNGSLLDDAWWGKQENGQLPGKIKAYGDTVTALTTGLLGFDVATPPATPAQFSASGLEAMLAKDAFDQNAAAQLIREAALTERLMASDQLTKAVKEFTTLSATVAASPAPENDAKKLRKEVQKSLRAVVKELARYSERIASSDKVYAAEKGLRKSTTAYLAKNGNGK